MRDICHDARYRGEGRTGQDVREICHRAARGFLCQLLPSVRMASEER